MLVGVVWMMMMVLLLAVRGTETRDPLLRRPRGGRASCAGGWGRQRRGGSSGWSVEESCEVVVVVRNCPLVRGRSWQQAFPGWEPAVVVLALVVHR